MNENDKTQIDDNELIKSFNAGSEPAFDELLTRYRVRIYRLAYGLLGNHSDAEEVVQDAFIKVYKNLKSFRGDSSFSTWLHRIAVNLSRNKYHWNKRRGSLQNMSISEKKKNADDSLTEDFELADITQSPQTIIEKSEYEERIMNAIRELPESLREVMMLRHLEDMHYESIAELTGANIGTVKSRLSRAREALAKILTR